MMAVTSRTTLLAGTSLFLCLAAALWPRPVQAYCRTTTVKPTREQLVNRECVKEGIPLYWDDLTIRYGFDATHRSTTMDDDLVREVFADAFEAWAAVTCEDGDTGLEFIQDPGFYQPGHPEPGHIPGSADNVNVVLFYDGNDWFDDPLHGPDQYALTSVWYVLSTGEIVGADMEINENKGPYTYCEDSGCPGGYSDLLNIVTHEVGHVLGLAETYDEAPEATMYFSATDGELHKRTLHEDDIAGLCSIYSPTAQLERGGAEDEHKGLCSVSHGATGASVPFMGAAWLLGLLFMVRRVRRQKCSA